METDSINNKRPVFLTIVCIVSFVGLGFIMMKSLVGFAFVKLVSSYYSLVQSGLEDSLSQMRMSDPTVVPLVENIFDSLLKLFNALPLFVGLTFALSAVALAGVILMWKLRKSGFYMFCAAKVIIIFLPAMLIGVNFLSLIMGTSSFMVAAIFITLYALNFKSME